MNEIKTLQKIYDSEINFVILSPCWDMGITVIIGPEPYGCDLSKDKCEYTSGTFKSMGKAVEHLVEKVLELYPDSTFTKNHLLEEAPEQKPLLTDAQISTLAMKIARARPEESLSFTADVKNAYDVIGKFVEAQKS
jgi:hypothetical protein